MGEESVATGKGMALDWNALGQKLRSGLAAFVQRSAHAKQVCKVCSSRSCGGTDERCRG
jgi:hypothetical protein